ncbi:MAG TPA: aldo/keto reductase, partial [Tepidiformaceae bacterium]|nr:aldo/keto reductase [Tepidiformaceae bacterium]
MQHTALGSTGMQVSRLCLGSMGFGWTASERESFSVMDAFADAGGNFIDTADVYSRWLPGHKGGEAETIIGRWMKQRGNRGEMVIATKVRGEMWPGPDGQGLSRQHIARAVEDSLRRLQTETIDLYQCHWFDDAVPIEETLRAMEDLIKAGKVRRIGLSNFPAPLIRAALNVSARHGLPRFETLQPHHSLVHRAEWEGELQQLCLAENFGVIPYSPLASGFLTGKYERGAAKVSSQRANAVKQYFTPDGWRTLDAVR